MKRLLFLLLLSSVIFYSCEETEPHSENDSTPPTVTITSPQNESTAYEIVTITCMSSDNIGVKLVELWVNGISTGLEDDSEPYSFEWNTTSYENGEYTIIIRSYDESDNTADSNPIILTVDNSRSIPLPVALRTIVTGLNSYEVTWSSSDEIDFKKYILSESFNSNMSNSTNIFETTSSEDTTHVVSELPLDDVRFFQVSVLDSFGYESKSNIVEGSSRLEILFERDSDLYLMMKNGGNQTQLTSYSPRDPSFSSDGSKIVFSAYGDESMEIYITNIDGTGEVRLTNDSYADSNPIFTPDNQYIIFHSDHLDSGGFDIFRIDIDGNNQIRLTNTSGYDRYPNVSSDGTKIVFVSTRTGDSEIFTMNSDGSNQVNITHSNGTICLNPTFSHDDSKILFTSVQSGVDFDIYIIDSDGRNLTRLNDNTTDEYRFDISPDDSKIVYTSEHGSNQDIFIMNIDGSNRIQLTGDDESNYDPQFSSAGSKLIFNSNRDGDYDIYSMDLDGRNQTNLTNSSTMDIYPLVRPNP